MRGGDDDLWAKAAELERQFERYNRRVAERRSSAAAAVADRHDGDTGDLGGAVEEVEMAAVVVGRGRRYDAYVRRRDEKLRQGWRARMERKEAEMKALWARLDVDSRRDGDLAAGRPDKEQKPGNLEAKPAASPATPRSSSAMKASLSRARTTPRTSAPSPAGKVASPRLSSNPDARRRAPHREPPQPEPPSTPRKENRVPSAAAAATATLRLRVPSRSRSSLKEPSDRSSSVRDSPRPPPPLRFQSPRPSHDGDAGDRPKQPPVLAPTTDDDAVAPAAKSCQSQQVVLAEIKTAAAFRLRRSGNGARQGRQPAASPRPVITRQVDGRGKPSDIGKMNSVQISRNSDVEAKNFNLDAGISEYDDTARSSVELGSLKITGDSDTEPSYVYIKKDIDEEALNTSQPQPLPASGSNAEEPEAPEPHQSEKETGDLEQTTIAASSEATAKENLATDQEDASPQSSDQSFYSNVDSFSHRSELELAASATDSPLHGSPSSTGPSTEQLLEADAAMLRKKREEDEEDDDAAASEINSLLIPSSSSSVACPVAVQSPMEAVAGLKRFLTFGKKNAAAVAPPADDDGVGHGWPSGDSGVRQRICSSDAASDDSDNSYVIPANVRSLQSCVPCSPAKPVLLKELISSAKSPRAHRSFFSFSSFKSRGY